MIETDVVAIRWKDIGFPLEPQPMQDYWEKFDQYIKLMSNMGTMTPKFVFESIFHDFELNYFMNLVPIPLNAMNMHIPKHSRRDQALRRYAD